MQINRFYIYSDASFSKKHQIGVAGFLIFNSTDNHNATKISSAIIRTITFKENNNIRVELKSIILALETFEMELNKTCNVKIAKNFEINVYTDSKSITNLLARRGKLEASNYISKRSKNILSNADIYKKFFAIYDRLRPNIYWVKGHSPKKDQDLIQKNFSYIDKIVRKKLRAIG